MAGFGFPVLCSAGEQLLARRVAARCQGAYQYLASVLSFTPNTRLLVLAAGDWAAHAGFPLYGMPHTAHGDTLVVGTRPAEFWHDVMQGLDTALTPKRRADLAAIYGTVDGRLDPAPLADLLVVHELGHLFQEQVPFTFPRLWLMELFANLFLQAYLVAAEPDQLPAWTALPETVAALPPEQFVHRSLADFERLYFNVGAANYCWYQFRLVVAIQDLYAAAGVEALPRLYHTFAAHLGDLSDEQLAEVLAEQVHPVAARMLREWPA